LDVDSGALDITKVAQAQAKCLEARGKRRWGRHSKESDPRHLTRLLRARCERPRRRAADERDELAASHCPMPPVLPTEKIAHLGTAGGYCAAGFQLRLCRLGVKMRRTPIERILSALPPVSDRRADIRNRQLRAKSCREQSQQDSDYSMTSSARASSVGSAFSIVLRAAARRRTDHTST